MKKNYKKNLTSKKTCERDLSIRTKTYILDLRLWSIQKKTHIKETHVYMKREDYKRDLSMHEKDVNFRPAFGCAANGTR